MTVTTTTGTVDFVVGDKTHRTWYKVHGNLKSGVTPVVGIHGGPGATHNYLTPLADLAANNSIPVVLYDQLGNGGSTHLKDEENSFWTEDLFLKELTNLLTKLGIQDKYSLLGHSWGGMLAARHAASQPSGLQRLILSDSPASIPLFVKAATEELMPQLKEDTRKDIKTNEEANTTDKKEYKDAVQEYYEKFLCRLDPWPAEMSKSFKEMENDPTVYKVMNGPCEIDIKGKLKDWTIIHDAENIGVPTLLLNGTYDAATDNTIWPYFQKISKVKWFTFASSSHMPLWEEREKYMKVAANFLLAK